MIWCFIPLTVWGIPSSILKSIILIDTPDNTRVKFAVKVDRLQPSVIRTKLQSEEKLYLGIKKEEESRAETLDKLDNDIKEYTETESQLKQEYEETIRTKATAWGDVTLTEELEAEYETIQEASAVASAKPRQALSLANWRLESAQANVASLAEDVKDRKSRKNDEAVKLKELVKRKKTIVEVSWNESNSWTLFFLLLFKMIVLNSHKKTLSFTQKRFDPAVTVAGGKDMVCVRRSRFVWM